ncbi:MULTISPECIES: S1 family peptidase [Xanthomonas]
MINSNVLHCVRQVKIGDNVGTLFTIEVQGLQYLVTANHLLEQWESGDYIGIWQGKEWRGMPVELVGTHEAGDVAVFASSMQLSQRLPLEASSKGLIWSQDVFFLGFPYGWRAEVPPELNGKYPLPFVKKAIVSAMVVADGFETIFLDGLNNPGFSGGPVVFIPPGSNDFQVCSVVTSFRYVAEPVYEGDSEHSLVYRANTGIIESTNIRIILELIKNNPIGLARPST